MPGFAVLCPGFAVLCPVAYVHQVARPKEKGCATAIPLPRTTAIPRTRQASLPDCLNDRYTHSRGGIGLPGETNATSSWHWSPREAFGETNATSRWHWSPRGDQCHLQEIFSISSTTAEVPRIATTAGSLRAQFFTHRTSMCPCRSTSSHLRSHSCVLSSAAVLWLEMAVRGEAFYTSRSAWFVCFRGSQDGVPHERALAERTLTLFAALAAAGVSDREELKVAGAAARAELRASPTM